MDKRILLILDDDNERINRFKNVLGGLWELHIWNNAHAMIQELPKYLDYADLISLDHDLYIENETSEDPGNGLIVAKWLEQQKPSCPIIVHSSNSERSNWMLGSLELGGWQTKQVYPIGNDWIENSWKSAVEELLK